jgi:predicted RNA-binding protein associated with RNAse of E/G family
VSELQDRTYRAVWFVFNGKWHDLGKIYRPSGQLVGYYCDIIRPMVQTDQGLKIDDLFLDLWISPDGRYRILDEDEFEEAVKLGWIDPKTADRAERELKKLKEKIESGRFPPTLAEKF